MAIDKALLEKWTPLLENENLPEIHESRHNIVALILENNEKELATEGYLNEAQVTGSYDNVFAGTKNSGMADIGPQVMGMARRSIPNMLMFDTLGVQPLTQPTGQVFAMRTIYGSDPRAADGYEAFHPSRAPRAGFSGTESDPAFNGGNAVAPFAADTTYAIGDVFSYDIGGEGDIRYFQVVVGFTVALGADLQEEFEANHQAGNIAEIAEAMATSIAELQQDFNGSSGNPWNEMSFRLDKQSVEAKSRQLKAQYSLELAQDLAKIHGMDADAELMNILSTEIQLEMDREAVTLINTQAQIGKSSRTGNSAGTPGVFDLTNSTDNGGARWQGEAFKSLMVQIEKEANEIGRQTGLGNGNFVIASRNVVSVLAQTDQLIGGSAIGAQAGLSTDTSNSVFAGVLAGRFRVYIDQFAPYDYITVGLRGSNMNAGLFYSPYVGLMPLRATAEKSFQPIMGLKTRYAMSVNPFVGDALPASGQTYANSLARGIGKNQWYRRFAVKGI